MSKSLVIRCVQLSILFLTLSSHASGFDEDTKRYLPVLFNNADAVVLVQNIKLEEKPGAGTEINAVVINVAKQSKRNRVRRYIDVSVAESFLYLKSPGALKQARKEHLRLSGCKKVLMGQMKRHPSDKTVCEDSVEAIDLKLADETFMSKANLGYYLSIGWDFDLSANRSYLIFLKDNDPGYELFRGVRGFVPVDEASLKYLVDNDYLDLD